LRIRLSDASAAAALHDHLALQGFPATFLGHDELDVLFPGAPPLLAIAAELDRWSAEHIHVTLTYGEGVGGGPQTHSRSGWSIDLFDAGSQVSVNPVNSRFARY
jgi:hypothetical protein